MNMRHEDGAIGFCERFARNSMWGMAGIGMFCAVAVVMQGAVFPFLAVVLTMALSHWFRRRAMQEQRRRNETLEDERDRAILARGDAVFRMAASIGMVTIALGLVVPAIREVVLDGMVRLPGTLLLALILANIAGHVAVLRGYAGDRR